MRFKPSTGESAFRYATAKFRYCTVRPAPLRTFILLPAVMAILIMAAAISQITTASPAAPSSLVTSVSPAAPLSPAIHPEVTKSASAGLATAETVPPSLLMDDYFIRDVRASIEHLYNRDLETSLEALADWKRAYPDHPIWPLWKALDAWWPILIDLENTSYDDDFLIDAQVVVDLCDAILKQDENHLDALVVRSVINGQIARYYSNRYRWYRSFLHGRRALRDFFHVEHEHPDMPDMQFGLGMYRYFTAFLVDEYAIARSLRWMLPSGDRADGLSRLAVAADSSIFVEPEATYFLGHIYLHFENEPDKALGYLRDLYHRYPHNSYYRRLYVRSLFNLNLHNDALAAIRESLDHPFDPDSHESLTMREDLHTIRALIQYSRSDYQAAQDDFLEAVANAEKLTPFAERVNLITSLYYLGQLSIRDGRRDLARFYFSRAATPDIDHPHVKKAREALRAHRLD